MDRTNENIAIPAAIVHPSRIFGRLSNRSIIGTAIAGHTITKSGVSSSTITATPPLLISKIPPQLMATAFL